MSKLLIAGFPGCHVQFLSGVFTVVFFIRIRTAVPVEKRNRLQLDISLYMLQQRLPTNIVMSRCNLEKETGKTSYYGRILFVWRGDFPSEGDLRKIKGLIKFSKTSLNKAYEADPTTDELRAHALDQRLPEAEAHLLADKDGRIL